MKRRIKDQLIVKTFIEIVILALIALAFWRLYLTYDYIPTILLAPKILAAFCVVLLVFAAAAGFLACKKNDRFYLRYVVYGTLYSLLGFYIVISMNIYVFYFIWIVTAVLAVFSIFYTVYRVR